MVAYLPVVSGKELIRILSRFGYKIVRQHGSHVRLKCSTNQRRPVTVPLHREIGHGLLCAILKQAGLEVGDIKE